MINHLNVDYSAILIKTLKPTIKSIIQDGYQLAYLLETINDNDNKLNLTEWLDNTLISIIEDHDQLEFVLNELPQDGKNKLNALFNSQMEARQDNPSDKTKNYRAKLQQFREESEVNKQSSIQVKK